MPEPENIFENPNNTQQNSNFSLLPMLPRMIGIMQGLERLLGGAEITTRGLSGPLTMNQGIDIPIMPVIVVNHHFNFNLKAGLNAETRKELANFKSNGKIPEWYFFY